MSSHCPKKVKLNDASLNMLDQNTKVLCLDFLVFISLNVEKLKPQHCTTHVAILQFPEDSSRHTILPRIIFMNFHCGVQ